MSTISEDEVRRVAALARISLTEAEVETMAAQLAVITSAVASVSEGAGPDVPATSHPLPLVNVMREDVVGPTLDLDEVLACAPAHQDGQFMAPQILGEE